MNENVLSMLDRVRLEKAATDAGFDVPHRDALGGWMSFASTSSPLRISLTVAGARPLAALSMANVLTELSLPPSPHVAVPAGTAGVFVVSDFSELQAVLARAYELANALPTALLEAWQAKVKSLPSTERDATVRQRVGQDLFRKGLLALWQGRCALTGLAVPELLRASHAKPWRDATDEERLDVFNGLLLVTPSGHRARGNFPSLKAPIGARYESGLEFDVLRVVEVSSKIRTLRTHPHAERGEIWAAREARSHAHGLDGEPGTGDATGPRGGRGAVRFVAFGDPPVDRAEGRSSNCQGRAELAEHLERASSASVGRASLRSRRLAYPCRASGSDPDRRLEEGARADGYRRTAGGSDGDAPLFAGFAGRGRADANP